MHSAATPTEPSTAELVNRVLERLRGFPEVRRVILFGSRAVGDADARSDLDLALSCPGIDHRRWGEIVAAVEETPTLICIDLVHLETAGDELARAIRETGRVVHERA